MDSNDLSTVEPVPITIEPDASASFREGVPDFQYTTTNVLPAGFEDDITVEGCLCSASEGPSSSCTIDASCECIEEHGCFYDHQDGSIDLDVLPPGHVLVECGPSCHARNPDSGLPTNCGNSLTQQGVRTKLRIRFASHTRGLGLFADEPIPKGRFICLYAGEIISSSEARTRYSNQPSNYILTVQEVDSRGEMLRTIIDPRLIGNVGRFANHSCPPLTNLIILPIRVTGRFIPHAAMFATRDIDPGEELTFDYSDAGGLEWFFGRRSEGSMKGSPAPTMKQPGGGTGTASDLKPCLCGSPGCRGWLPFDNNLV